MGREESPPVAALVRLFGRVRVTIGGTEVVPGGVKQRAVLAMLALADGRDVHADRLTDGIWEDPPADPAASLRVYVSNLRRALREVDGDGRDPIVGRYPLYRLAAHVSCDAAEARRLADAAAGSVERDPYRSADLLSRAVGLVDGPPLADQLALPFAAPAVAALAALRDRLEHDRARSIVQAQGPERALEQIRALVDADPARTSTVLLLAETLAALDLLDDARSVLDRHVAEHLDARPTPEVEAARTRLARPRTPDPRVGEMDPFLAACLPVAWVGRVAEREVIRREYEAHRNDGSLRVVTITGVGGSGKTTLAAVAGRDLCDAGARVLYVDWTHDSPTALQPLVRAGLLTDEDTGGPGTLSDRAVDVAERLKCAVRERAGTGPVVLVVDDLHWAAGRALDVIGTLTADPDLPALILLLSRPEPRGWDAEVGAAIPVARVRLGPLSTAESTELLSQLNDSPADAADGALYPWVLQVLAPTGDPAAQRARLETGLDELAPELAGLAEHLSLDPDGLTLTTLVAVTSGEPAATLAHLRTLVADGLVEEMPGLPLRYRLAHDLIREIVQERVGPSRAVTLAAHLHGVLAQTEARASRRLRHALAAVEVVPREASETFVAAADELLAAGMYGDAVDLARQAAAHAAVLDPRVLDHLGTAAAFARSATGADDDAEGALLDLATRAAGRGDWAGTARALRLRHLLNHAPTADPAEDELVERALAAVDAGATVDPHVQFDLTWLRFMGLLYAGRPVAELRSAAASVAERSTGVDDPSVRCLASHVRHQVQVIEGESPHRMAAVSRRTLRYAREAGSDGLLVYALSDMLLDRLADHDVDGTAAVAAELDSLRDPRGRWYGMVARALVALDDCDVDGAADLTAQAHAFGQRHGVVVADDAFLSQSFGQAWVAGTLAGYVPFFADVDWKRPSGALYGAAHAVCLAQGGDTGAATLADEVAAHVESEDLAGWMDVATVALLAEAAALTGAVGTARVAARRLEPWGGRRVTLAAVLDLGPADRYRGLCARVLGDCVAAEAALEAASRHAACPLWVERIGIDAGAPVTGETWGWLRPGVEQGEDRRARRA